MFQLAKPDVTPPGGYWYYDPDLETKYSEGLLATLVATVDRQRRINNLEVPPDLSNIIEDAICRKLPDELRKVRPAEPPNPCSGPPDGPFPSLSPTPSTKSNRTTVITERVAIHRTLSILRRTTRLIPWDEAVPRTTVCRRCIHNVREPGCYSCKTESVFSPRVGKTPLGPFNFMGICDVDQSFLKATMRVDTPCFGVDTSSFGEGAYPPFCWKLFLEEEKTT